MLFRSTELLQTLENDIHKITAELKTLREEQEVALYPGLSADVLEDFYTQNVDSLSNYLQVESQVSQFNDDLNESMRVRGLDISEINEDKERSYIIASSIMLATEIIAVIGLAAITGGTAAPAAATALISIAAGTNSIIKGATDYQDNIVMVSQSANFGEIAGSSSSSV